jgi:hypothetical protein
MISPLRFWESAAITVGSDLMGSGLFPRRQSSVAFIFVPVKDRPSFLGWLVITVGSDAYGQLSITVNLHIRSF